MQKAYKRVLFYIVAWCSVYGAISDLFAKIRDFYRARYGKLSVRPSVRLPTSVFTIRPFGLRPCPPLAYGQKCIYTDFLRPSFEI